MSTGTINIISANLGPFDGNADYNRAIDDACYALDATGNESGWMTVRALREPKIPFGEAK